MPSSSRDSISAEAEDLFFASGHLSTEEWRRCLAAGCVGSIELTAEMREELEELVAQLEHVSGADQPAAGSDGGYPEPLNLRVTGRQGCQYELVRKIGTGGHSTVYEAIQREPFQRPVAVKVYYASSKSSDSLGELREIQALTRLQHPGICQVLDAGVTPWQQPFLVLELIVGSPLDRHIAEQNLAFDQRLLLVTQVVEIIADAHIQGVIHRDLKPQNVLVHAASGRVKLIDFSIAGISDPTATARSNSTAAGYGTRTYQSPEQAGLIHHPVDHRSDLYSLGCVLFEVLTGDPAFPAEAADLHLRAATDERRRQATLRASLSSRLLERLSDLFDRVPLSQRQAIAAVVERCVEEAPDDRIQSATELKQHLDTVTAGLPLELPPAPAARRRRLKQATLLAVAAGCLMAVLATGAVYWGSGRDPALPQPFRGDLGSSREDLLIRSELMAIELSPDVAASDLPGAKEKGAAFVQQLEESGLLTTTAEGLMVLTRYTHLLLEGAVAADRAEAARLLSPLANDPEQILAVDQEAGEQVLLEAMDLQLLEGHPAGVLVIAEAFTAGGLAEPDAATDVVARWAHATTEALLQTGRSKEAVALAWQVLNTHANLALERRNELLLFIASAYEREKRLQEALDVLTPMLTDEQPQRSVDAFWVFMTHLQAGRCQVKLEQFAEAAALLQQATAIMAQWPATVPFDGPVFTWVWLGNAEEGCGNRKAAQEAFSTALTNLHDACDAGRLSEEMRVGLGDQLQERIARLEAAEQDREANDDES
jgi:serine/threonine protein kinase/tetratricopeptide (TPR) repeat protein